MLGIRVGIQRVDIRGGYPGSGYQGFDTHPPGVGMSKGVGIHPPDDHV